MMKGVRTFRSSEGFVIHVGRDAESNEELSLEVARPYDFWLHAAAAQGAHVVVENPERLPRLPRQSLQEAAALAAWFSKARGGGSVSVHHTQARNVRKPRGLPQGTVEIREYRSIRARPELPSTVEAEDPS